MAELFKVNNLVTQFETESGLVKAVDNMSNYIDEQEIIGLVRQSIYGKTTIGRCILGL